MKEDLLINDVNGRYKQNDQKFIIAKDEAVFSRVILNIRDQWIKAGGMKLGTIREDSIQNIF